MANSRLQLLVLSNGHGEDIIAVRIIQDHYLKLIIVNGIFMTIVATIMIPFQIVMIPLYILTVQLQMVFGNKDE
ncbi:MAG: hypothetical protein ACKPDM_16150 [Dolichospermum sp.]